ncbi:MAG: PAC2 family protein [Dehalococcoides mccartyi]|nr:PAC2 family protein [Dehalococcoides mccartyi]MBJ7532020.1 PAC2 family protein [Dehalococcoides mccartyi]
MNMEAKNPQAKCLIIAWQGEFGLLSERVLAEIEKQDTPVTVFEVEIEKYFSLNGVAVKDDLTHFPGGELKYLPGGQLLVFRGSIPEFSQYEYLDRLVNTALAYQVNEIICLGSVGAMISHTAPRRLMAVVNSDIHKYSLENTGVECNMNFDTPPNQKVDINSFVIWLAGKYGINAMSLWQVLPFYLQNSGDAAAELLMLEFLGDRFALKLNLAETEQKVKYQSGKISTLCQTDTRIASGLKMLEGGLSLDAASRNQLLDQISRLFEDC